MEDKIEVGEYIRTNEGDIFEFGGYFKSGNIDSMTDKDGILYGNQEKCCKKHSKNIIDLIKVGDYVNGHLVLEKQENEIICEIDNRRGGYLYTVYEKGLEKQIKSIVTKEQFEQVQYKVGE